jgi:cobalamin synthase
MPAVARHQLASIYLAASAIVVACTGLPATAACSLLAPACQRLKLPPAVCLQQPPASEKSEGAHLAGKADEGAWAHAGVVTVLLLACYALQDAVGQHITPTTQSILQQKVSMRLVPQ